MMLGARTGAWANGGETMEKMTFGVAIINAAQVYTWFKNNEAYWNCAVFRRDPSTVENQIGYVIVNSSGVATFIARSNKGIFEFVQASVAYEAFAEADDVYIVIRPKTA